MKKRIVTRKKVAIFIVFIILYLLIISGFLIVRDKTNENILRKEVDKLTHLNMAVDAIDREIYSGGGYALVETAIKDYIGDYSNHYKDLLRLLEDDSYRNVLGIDNYQKDGPLFENSISNLTSKKEKILSSIDYLLAGLEDENMDSFVLNYTKDEKLISLYHELMFGENVKNDLDNSRENLKKTRTDMDNLFTTSLTVLNFLKEHKDEWKIEDNQIKFVNQDLVNEYNNYVVKLRK